MDKKKSFGQSLEAFFAGKGFYIVLFLCVAVIGVSAWTMLAGDMGEDDIGSLDSLSAAEEPVEAVSALPSPSLSEAEPEEAKDTAPVANIEPEEPVQQTAAPAEPSAPSSPALSSADTVPVYFIRPVAGEVENGYSMTALQYNRTMQDWRTHDGIDIASELGAQVKAVADGTVEKVYSDDALGTTVVLAHSGGLKSVYSNLAESPTVSEGDAVATGSVIGSVGTTALSETGEVNHLHFAMSLNGESVDPENYLP